MNPEEILISLRQRARDILGKPDRLMGLIEQSKNKFKEFGIPDIKSLKNDFLTAIRLLRAYVNGSYRQIPWQSLVMIVASLIYFINPFDIIPDFIPLQGLIDDATVMLFTFKSVQTDLNQFRNWEETEPESDSTSA